MEMTSLTPAIIRDGGMLDFNCHGIAGCVRCGWRGVASKADPRCPNCQAAPETDKAWRELERVRAGAPRVSRNAPCPCGSGKKAKKCCHA